MARLPGSQRIPRSLCTTRSAARCPPALHRLRRPLIPHLHPPHIHHPPAAPFTSHPSSPPIPRIPAYTHTARWTHRTPPPPRSLLSSHPPLPPPYPIALYRWACASTILLFGFLAELPLLLTWRLLRSLASLTPAPLSPLLSRLSLRPLTLSYHLRIRYAHLTLHTLHLHLTVINHNPSPFLIHTPQAPPYLFIQTNQTSLLDSLTLHAASHLRLLHLLPPTPPHAPTPFLLSTPHLLLNWEFALFPLWGWVQSVTSVWLVRGWRWQCRGAVDRVMRRMRRGGDSFYMSVEGRRMGGGDGGGGGGELGEYKGGAGVVAVGVGAVVVPVVMKGSRQAMGVGEWRVREVGVTVIYEEAIDARGLQFEDRRKVISRIRDAYERVRREEQGEEEEEMGRRATSSVGEGKRGEKVPMGVAS